MSVQQYASGSQKEPSIQYHKSRSKSKAQMIEISAYTEIFLFSHDDNLNQMVMIYDDDDFTSQKSPRRIKRNPSNKKIKKTISVQSHLGRFENVDGPGSLEGTTNINKDDPRSFIESSKYKLPMNQPLSTKVRKKILSSAALDMESPSLFNSKVSQKNAAMFQKMDTNVKMSTQMNNFYDQNMNLMGEAEEQYSPIKTLPIGNGLSSTQGQPTPSNLVYIQSNNKVSGGSPLGMSKGVAQPSAQKTRVASAARAQPSNQMRNKMNLLTTTQSSRRGASGFREIKNRASRFNLTFEEYQVYQNFAGILATFDEETMKDLLECMMKDAQDLQSQKLNNSHQL